MLLLIIRRASSQPNLPTIVFLMILLMVYQLMEFLICAGVNENIIGRVAFVSITLLPPAGHYLANQLLQSKIRDHLVSFVLGIGFSFYFAVLPDSIALVDCNPFYAVYNYPQQTLYSIYYYLILLYAIGKVILDVLRNGNSQQSLLLLGYFGFLLPMAVTLVFNQAFTNAIPSIMCKYAIVLAIVLTVLAVNGAKKLEIRNQE